MRNMFNNAAAFTGAIASWDVEEVTDMNNMFYSAAAFNGAIASWDVGKVTNMVYMFNGATAFTDCSKKALADEWATNNAFMVEYGKDDGTSWEALSCGTC